jgi:hypothetical protein
VWEYELNGTVLGQRELTRFRYDGYGPSGAITNRKFDQPNEYKSIVSNVPIASDILRLNSHSSLTKERVKGWLRLYTNQA